MKKQYIGISRDHSGSMGSLRTPAMKDYNETISTIKQAAGENGIDTIVSVASCGINSGVQIEVKNSSVNSLKPLTNYRTDGGTPLFDSVGELIMLISTAPDYNDPNVTFLVMAITDGEENASSPTWKKGLGPKIQKLQATDRWTFVFRVPRGYRRKLELLGIPSGNIQEWDQTDRGLQESSVLTTSAISNYYKNVSSGVRSTKSFYADLSGVTQSTAARKLRNINGDVLIYPVNNRTDISSFISLKTRKPYQKGTAFYQLTKPEKAVQDYKIVVIQNQNTGEVYGGAEARQLLKLPTNGTITLRPGNHGDWNIFIQSTSSNRVLLPGTSALYWEDPK